MMNEFPTWTKFFEKELVTRIVISEDGDVSVAGIAETMRLPFGREEIVNEWID